MVLFLTPLIVYMGLSSPLAFASEGPATIQTAPQNEVDRATPNQPAAITQQNRDAEEISQLEERAAALRLEASAKRHCSGASCGKTPSSAEHPQQAAKDGHGTLQSGKNSSPATAGIPTQVQHLMKRMQENSGHGNSSFH